MPAPVAWLKNIQEWLDHHGPMAWIATMVLGFIFVWPLGLVILFYMIGTNRMWKRDRTQRCGHFSRSHNTQQTGNVAFDKYRDETLRRLEEEQKAFTGFLDQLRAAKDQAEFDQFMDQRSRRPAATPSEQQPPRATDFGDAAPA